MKQLKGRAARAAFATGLVAIGLMASAPAFAAESSSMRQQAAVTAAATQSSTATPYEMWQFRNGRICFQTGGSTYWPITQAVAAWNKSDIDVVADVTCSAFSRAQTVIFKAYYDSSKTAACAKTGSNIYKWEYVTYNGVKQARWVPNLMVIWLNWDPYWAKICRGTVGARTHLVAHEAGHAMGFAHNQLQSIMYYGSGNIGWSYQLPTSVDLQNANARY